MFNYIKYLKNQDNFSSWVTMDPNMIKTYSGTDGEIGFISSWKSDNEEVGEGEQEITAIFSNQVEYELRFKKPFESTAPAYMITENFGNGQTLVKWGFDGHMDYPSNVMLLFMDFKSMIGDDFDKGLNRLKKIMEKK